LLNDTGSKFYGEISRFGLDQPYSHGLALSTSAAAVGAELFNGFDDNTDVTKKIMSLV
jgi:hypothetical protein